MKKQKHDATYTAFRIIVEHDPDPDFSWLEQDMYDPSKPEYGPIYRTKADQRAGRAMDGEWYRNPENHVALEMTLHGECACCGAWTVLDSLGNIDFFADSDEWATGTFLAPKLHGLRGYLRQCAREMLAPYKGKKPGRVA
jgi:hypothetical protein